MTRTPAAAATSARRQQPGQRQARHRGRLTEGPGRALEGGEQVAVGHLDDVMPPCRPRAARWQTQGVERVDPVGAVGQSDGDGHEVLDAERVELEGEDRAVETSRERQAERTGPRDAAAHG